MGILDLARERIASWISPSRTRQALVPGSADIEANAHLWRRAGEARRDLPGYKQDQAIAQIHDLIRRNGLAARIVDDLENYCVGEAGATLKSRLPDAKREKHEALLAECWKEPQTDWPRLMGELPRTFRPIGEMLFTHHGPPRGKAGGMAHAVIDPEDIDRLIQSPLNARQTVGVLRKGGVGALPFFHFDAAFRAWVEGAPGPVKQALTGAGILPLPEPGTEAEVNGCGLASGKGRVRVGADCSYFGFRRFAVGTRGVSWFFPVAEWLDAINTANIQHLDLVDAQSTIAAHATTPGGKPAQDALHGLLRKVLAPGGGRTVVTDKDVTLDFKNPNIGAYAFGEEMDTRLKFVAAQLGVAETWLGLGTDAGNSATTELAGPTLKMLKKAQGEVRDIAYRLLSMQAVALAPAHGLTAEEAVNFDIVLPDIGGRDAVRENAVVQGTTASLSTAVAERFVTREKAAAIWQKQVSEATGEEFQPEDTPPEEPEEPEVPDGEDDSRVMDEVKRLAEERRRAKESRRRKVA